MAARTSARLRATDESATIGRLGCTGDALCRSGARARPAARRVSARDVVRMRCAARPGVEEVGADSGRNGRRWLGGDVTGARSDCCQHPPVSISSACRVYRCRSGLRAIVCRKPCNSSRGPSAKICCFVSVRHMKRDRAVTPSGRHSSRTDLRNCRVCASRHTDKGNRKSCPHSPILSAISPVAGCG